MKVTGQDIKVKAYSPGELAALYDIDGRTFNNWVRSIKDKVGERQGRYYTPAQVRIILKHLGVPCYVYEEPIIIK